MAKKVNHEANFRTEFCNRYGQGVLTGKRRFVEPGNLGRAQAAETSSDESFEYDGWLVLVEIDAFNVAKPSVGQYFLLNHLVTHEHKKTLFLVLSHYAGFNEQRTSKYLRFAASNVGVTYPIRYLALTKEQFWALCNECSDVGSLVRALTTRSRGTVAIAPSP